MAVFLAQLLGRIDMRSSSCHLHAVGSVQSDGARKAEAGQCILLDDYLPQGRYVDEPGHETVDWIIASTRSTW